MSTYQRADLVAAAIADAFAAPIFDRGRERTEFFASPMSPICTVGARLAKLTSNPDLLISDGESVFLGGVPPLGGKDVVEGWIPFRKVFDVVNHGRRHVMMGATQIDREGNQNISAIGPFAQPKRQLLGSRGAPGNTANNRTSYFVPNHSTRVFIENVDVVTGISQARAEAAGVGATKFHDLHRIVSNLGVFDFTGPGGTVALRSVHPWSSVEEIVAATGFELTIPADVPVTREPTSEEVTLITHVIDPKGMRLREVPEPEEASA